MQNNHTALLLTNLGSPKKPLTKDVKKYLTAFLMDKRVIDYPLLFRFLLVRGIIVPSRASNSAASYRKIWTTEGSPLIVESEKLRNKVAEKANFPVALSMRYGEPRTEDAFDELLKQNPELKNIIVLPLYPQYTMSSYGTAVEEIKRVNAAKKYAFKLQFIDPFYNQPDYISALSERIHPYLEEGFDKILFSYHGLPERHMKKDDRFISRGGSEDFQVPAINYHKQAYETSALVAEKLNISKDKYEVSFQSRLTAAGKEWIKPYTTNRLSELPKEGTKRLLVVCPAFINDCLETLEEIGMQEKLTLRLPEEIN
ncbi:MAG TPA: ferrochelatase [Chitinophagaceae bacterium]|nr:ferrochelatase [Chitinophagaceae bacterium]